MKKAEGKSPKSEVRSPKHQGATSCPASAFSLQPSAFTRILWWLLPVSLVLVTLALYWPASGFGFINYDDDFYVTSNVHVQNGLTWAGIPLMSGQFRLHAQSLLLETEKNSCMTILLRNLAPKSGK